MNVLPAPGGGVKVGTASEITVRRATSADDREVRRMFGALHSFNASLEPRFALANGWESVLQEHLVHERAHHHGATFLAECDHALAGLLMMDSHTESPLYLFRHWAEIVALYVEPWARGRSIAARLIETAGAWAHEHGFERIQLYVTATNLPARRVYARNGFNPVQEVWARDIGKALVAPDDDPACESAYAHGHRLLTSGPHRLTPDDEACAENQQRLSVHTESP